MKKNKTKFQKIMSEFYSRKIVNYVLTGELFPESPIETLARAINKVNKPKSK